MRPDSWRGIQAREQVIKAALYGIYRDITKQRELRCRVKREKARFEQLFAANAGAKELHSQAYGWAVFDNTKVAFGVSGGGGSGVAVDKGSGDRVYMKMGTGGVGLGLVVNKFQVVFLFQDQQTLKNFIDKGWQADAGATASAIFGSLPAAAKSTACSAD